MFGQISHFQHDFIIRRIAAVSLGKMFGLQTRSAHEVLDYWQSHRSAAHVRATHEERLRIWMLRRFKNLLGCTLLFYFTVLHDHDSIGNFTHHCEVVGDKQDRHMVRFLKLGDEVENLLLNRYIQRRCRFIGN